MSAFVAALVRMLCCWGIFGLTASILHGSGMTDWLGVVLAAILALAVNARWRQEQRVRLAREHREAVENDETVRQIVRERRHNEHTGM